MRKRERCRLQQYHSWSVRAERESQVQGAAVETEWAESLESPLPSAEKERENVDGAIL